MFFELFFHVIGEDALTAKEHTHINRMEVIHIVSGEGTILLGKNTYAFSSGDVFFFDGSVPHNTLPTDKNKYERNKLIFEKSVLSVFAGIPFHDHIYFHADPLLATELDKLFHSILDCQKAAQPLLAVSHIFQLLHLCETNCTALKPTNSDFRQRIMDYINLHLQEALSIDSIAAYMHVSKFHMCKRFKAETGITIGNYIRMQRLYLAKKRLTATTDSISSIALDCGFNDLAHFTKFFHAAVKMTPSAYRKQHTVNF